MSTGPSGQRVVLSGLVATPGQLTATGYLVRQGQRAAEAARAVACRGALTVSKTGRARVPCALTRYGRGVLAEGGVLRVVVRFVPASSERSVTRVTQVRVRALVLSLAVAG